MGFVKMKYLMCTYLPNIVQIFEQEKPQLMFC